MPQEPATLTIWDTTGRFRRRQFDPAGAEANKLLVVDLPATVAEHDRITLQRAAARNGIAEDLVREDPNLDGEPWYDGLGRIERMRIDVAIDDETTTLTCPRDETDNKGELLPSGRAERITVRLDIRRGGTVTTLDLPSDLAIDAGEYEIDIEDAGIVATADSELKIPELQSLLEEIFFSPADDDRADSVDTQRHVFGMAAHVVACEALLEPDRGIEEAIRYAVEQELADLLPEDRGVDIRYRPGDGGESARIEVELQPPATPEPSRSETGQPSIDGRFLPPEGRDDTGSTTPP